MSTENILTIAFAEDLPKGDVTTNAITTTEIKGRARLVAKEDLVLSGSDVFNQALIRQGPSLEIKWQFEDGDTALNGQILATIVGDISALLKAERVALNFLSHLSGVATWTKCFVKQVEASKCKILDTRKTIPGLRDLQKKAVVDGGGHNHRMNLSDQGMIKENHVLLAGGLSKAMEKLRIKGIKPVTVEVKNLDELKEAIACEPDRIMLDNFDNELIAEALKLIPAHIESEASGGMTLERVARVAELGVNSISVGALTHSAPAADISLLVESIQL